jgi:hypothetical protein
MGTNSFVHARKKLDNFFGKIHANLVLNYNEIFFKYPKFVIKKYAVLKYTTFWQNEHP